MQVLPSAGALDRMQRYLARLADLVREAPVLALAAGLQASGQLNAV
ncbi:MAG TPA: hypothetical protein IGS51_05015 [Thermoleptolyngbya sp. M55_K2018_002]|nr:hypothetical protein [Thermoleptolyngbya sp. M55_K2018_002]